MNRHNIFLSILMLSVLSYCSFLFTEQSWAEGIITRPRAGTSIKNRGNFPVSWSIKGYDQDRANNWHYWMSIANASDSGQLTEHWPNFYIRSGHASRDFHDGGKNDLPTPEKKVLLLLKIDDGTNAQFVAWKEHGRDTGQWPGIPVQRNQIVHQVPIEFPN